MFFKRKDRREEERKGEWEVGKKEREKRKCRNKIR